MDSARRYPSTNGHTYVAERSHEVPEQQHPLAEADLDDERGEAESALAHLME